MAGTVAAVVSAGASVAGTTMAGLLDGTAYNVACGIEVENLTKWCLENPVTHTKWGYVKTPATTIKPAKREAVITHKCGGTTTGTSGTVVWQVNGPETFFIMVMWAVPFNQTHHSNWMGIGITNYDHEAHKENLFDTMYYEKENHFKREEYCRSSKTITYKNRYVEIEGSMGTSRKPTIKIIVTPVEKIHYAPAIKAALGMKE